MDNYPLIDERNEERHVLIPMEYDRTEYPHINYLHHGMWYAVKVERDGYTWTVAATPFLSETECQKACDIHNNYWGWEPADCDLIVSKSMGLLEWDDED